MKEKIEKLIKKYNEVQIDAENCIAECGDETAYGTSATAKQIIRDLENLIK